MIKKMQRIRKWHKLTAIEQALFYELVELCNQAGWTERFTCTNADLCHSLHLYEKTLIRSRRTLIENGLISYRSGKSLRSPGLYSLTLDLENGGKLPDINTPVRTPVRKAVGKAVPETDYIKTKTETKTQKKKKKGGVGERR